MKTLIAISLCCMSIATAAQYTGGTGGGGFTNCSSAFAMLPVELLHFTARPEGEHVALQWATATELNNAGFHVERSSDGERYDAILEVAGMGTTQQVTHYAVIDRAPLPGLSYYRLRQTDFDGTVTLSDAVAVGREQGALGAYPNPTADVLHITGLVDGALVEIIDHLGRVIMTERSHGALLTLDGTRWPAGRYTARVVSDSGVRNVGIIKH